MDEGEIKNLRKMIAEVEGWLSQFSTKTRAAADVAKTRAAADVADAIAKVSKQCLALSRWMKHLEEVGGVPRSPIAMSLQLRHVNRMVDGQAEMVELTDVGVPVDLAVNLVGPLFAYLTTRLREVEKIGIQGIMDAADDLAADDLNERMGPTFTCPKT